MGASTLNIHESRTEYFVKKGSIVREIWGKSDTVLMIFAGAAAEFALSKAVDWLYFTGRLPSDPLNRLFSTVTYARKIVFSRKQSAENAIDMMSQIHKGVEIKRGASIPQWAYRDVLFMLIDYSIRSFETLGRKLTTTEKREIFEVFSKVGHRMQIQELPSTFEHWLIVREEHLNKNFQRSEYTNDLFQQYQRHLGRIRYNMLLGLQALIVPKEVHELMHFGTRSIYPTLISLYKFTRIIRLDGFLKSLILPSEYKEEIQKLDTN